MRAILWQLLSRAMTLIIITVRATAFEHSGDGGSAAIEELSLPIPEQKSNFISQFKNLNQSDLN